MGTDPIFLIWLLEKIELLVRHGDRQLHCALGSLELLALADAAGRFPAIALAAGERHLAELLLAEPVSVALIRAFPERLCLALLLRRHGTSFLIRRRPPRSSSARASSCAGLRLRRSPWGPR